VKTPVQAPRANAVAEGWVGTARRECLDHVFIFGRRHLQRVLGAYTEHYNRARRHRASILIRLILLPLRKGSLARRSVGATFWADSSTSTIGLRRDRVVVLEPDKDAAGTSRHKSMFDDRKGDTTLRPTVAMSWCRCKQRMERFTLVEC
jgi:hypothetical protein